MKFNELLTHCHDPTPSNNIERGDKLNPTDHNGSGGGGTSWAMNFLYEILGKYQNKNPEKHRTLSQPPWDPPLPNLGCIPAS